MFETLTLLSVLVYAYVAVRQWHEMIAARHQGERVIAETSRTASATEAANRPWLGLDNSDNGAIVLNEGVGVANANEFRRLYAINGFITKEPPAFVSGVFAKFYLRFLIKNFGHAPASVRINAEVIDVDYPHGDRLLNAMKNSKVCEEEPKEWMFTVIPGETSYYLIRTLDLQSELIRKRHAIRPTVVGCIDYRFTVGDTKTIHKTPFAGQISMATTKEGNRAGPEPVEIPTLDVLNSKLSRDDLKVVDVWVIGEPN